MQLSPRETSISVRTFFVVFAVLALLLLPSAATAQTADPAAAASGPPANAPLPQSEAELARGLPILRILVSGNRRITPEDVVTYLRERSGQEFSPEALTQDVRELYGSGFFDDIEVDLERLEEGVVLRFQVRERPSVTTVSFEGNTEIDNEDCPD